MLNVQGVGAWSQVRFPLPDGDRGTAKTINEIVRPLVDEGLTDPRVRRLATEIVRRAGIPPFNDLAEVRALFDWCLDWRNVIDGMRAPRFFRDMVGKEMLQPAWSIIESGSGDCDCINAVLLPSLLGSIGYPTRAVTVAADPEDPAAFSHIYIEALIKTANGYAWIPLDVARPGAEWGRTPELAFRVKRWPLMEAAEGIGAMSRPVLLNGLSGAPAAPCRSRLTGLRFGVRRGARALGDASSDLSTIIQGTPGIESGVAQIVAAANQPSFHPYVTLPPGSSPYGQYGQGGALTISGGGSSIGTIGLLLILGLGLVLVVKK
ncbi:MAG TPA: transglutaminase-like domain-containing protein [Candidatus Acidoferrales bacterium]|nr:transglutaminase-like domain-containing protein [Candidatus Acidoferrales bacterium]